MSTEQCISIHKMALQGKIQALFVRAARSDSGENQYF
jgi:hypothetical protein